jgi:hypothetical protein
MRYMFLLYVPKEVREDPGARASLEDWMAYGRALVDAGAHLGDNALEGLETATTVRVRDGEVLLTDGPFAEGREQVGGLALINCRDLDEAVEIAAGHPATAVGQTEIRPVRS